LIDLPRCLGSDFVHPSAMRDGFASLGMRHGRSRLLIRTQLIRADPDDQVDVGERKFRLPKLKSVTTHL
jgi:hypothetical protein